MPLYEYCCRACGCHFEKLIRSISQPLTVLCESCGSADVEKLISVFSFGPSGGSAESAASSSSSSCGSCSSHHCSTCH